MKLRYIVPCGIAPALGVALLISTGCNSASTPPSPEATGSEQAAVSVLEGEIPSEEQQQAMLAAKDALFQKLSGRLMEAIGNQGPAGAIAVCKDEAIRIAADVSDMHGLKIGRTGVRLRNPNNQPPAWAKSMTEAKVDTPQFVSLTNGNAAALLPIKLQAQCLMCHGSSEQLAPLVGEQIAKLYPNDQATGFQEGELRGWFWIEKPIN